MKSQASAAELEHSARARSVLAHHTVAVEAAEIFSKAKPRLAVYSHIVLRGNVSAREIMRATRRAYHGAVVMGEDLMCIDVLTQRVTRAKLRRAA